MEDKYVTDDGMWVSVVDNIATVGFTDEKQKDIGDIMYIKLPEVNKTYKKGDEFGETECIKTVEPYYVPVSCVVTSINEKLEVNI